MVPELSFIVPVYNAHDTLRQCIGSLLGQNEKNVEILLIDDGSTDDSLSICREYESDERIRVLAGNHAGTSSARNIGLDAARGRFILFCDSDDCITPDAADALIKLADRYEADCVFCGIRYKYKTHETDSVPLKTDSFLDAGSPDRLKLVYSAIQSCVAKLMRRSIIESNGIRFRTDMNFAEDSDFANRYLMHCGNLVSSEGVFYIYNRCGAETTVDRYNENINFCCGEALKYHSASARQQDMSENDRFLISADAVRRLSYVTAHYVRHIGHDREKCIAKIRESWEQMRGFMDAAQILKLSAKDAVPSKTFLLLSMGLYEEVYDFYLEMMSVRNE